VDRRRDDARESESLNAAPVRPAPTRGGDDELLADPPPGAPPGGLDGYRAGLPMRVGLVIAIVAGVSATAWQVVQWQREKKAAEDAPLEPTYALPDADDGAGAAPGERPSKLVWSDGQARLGLSRQQPGVQEIVLPDRRVRLAPGHDVAQIKVDVQEGKTIKLAVLVGQVVQLPPEGQQSKPAPAATEP
jgi:hypothetical protein